MMTNCGEARLSLGVYALGMLEPEECVLVEAHLARCDTCQMEFEELSGVYTFLGRVSEEDVAQVGRPPRAVLDRLLSARARRRRTTRTLLAVAASVLVVGVGGTVWTASRLERETVSSQAAPLPASAENANPFVAREKGPPSASDDARVMGAPGSRLVWKGRDDPVRATVTATEREGTIAVKVVLSGVAMGTPCRLDVVAADGTRQTAGNWIVDQAAYDESVAFPGTTTIPLGSISKFEIVTDGGRTLVSVHAR